MINIPPTGFTLMVTKSPFDYRNAENALAFCYAALNNGHAIAQVFFYQAGVHNASRFLSPASDELNVYKRWCELYEHHQIILNVCVTAASRRGIVQQFTNHPGNVTLPFMEVGLSAYFEALADNTVNIQL